MRKSDRIFISRVERMDEYGRLKTPRLSLCHISNSLRAPVLPPIVIRYIIKHDVKRCITRLVNVVTRISTYDVITSSRESFALYIRFIATSKHHAVNNSKLAVDWLKRFDELPPNELKFPDDYDYMSVNHIERLTNEFDKSMFNKYGSTLFDYQGFSIIRFIWCSEHSDYLRRMLAHVINTHPSTVKRYMTLALNSKSSRMVELVVDDIYEQHMTFCVKRYVILVIRLINIYRFNPFVNILELLDVKSLVKMFKRPSNYDSLKCFLIKLFTTSPFIFIPQIVLRLPQFSVYSSFNDILLCGYEGRWLDYACETHDEAFIEFLRTSYEYRSVFNDYSATRRLYDDIINDHP